MGEVTAQPPGGAESGHGRPPDRCPRKGWNLGNPGARPRDSRTARRWALDRVHLVHADLRRRPTGARAVPFTALFSEARISSVCRFTNASQGIFVLANSACSASTCAEPTSPNRESPNPTSPCRPRRSSACGRRCAGPRCESTARGNSGRRNPPSAARPGAGNGTRKPPSDTASSRCGAATPCR